MDEDEIVDVPHLEVTEHADGTISFSPQTFQWSNGHTVHTSPVLSRVNNAWVTQGDFIDSVTMSRYANYTEDKPKEKEEPMGKKYKFTGETKVFRGTTLHQIVSVISFNGYSEGRSGGWVEKEENLSHNGVCWIAPDAIVMGNAQVLDAAAVLDDSVVSGNAVIKENAIACGRSEILGDAVLSGSAIVYEDAVVRDNAEVTCGGKLYGHSVLDGNAKVDDYAALHGRVHVSDDSVVKGDVVVADNVTIAGASCIKGQTRITGNSALVDCVIDSGLVFDNVKLSGIREESRLILTSEILMHPALSQMILGVDHPIVSRLFEDNNKGHGVATVRNFRMKGLRVSYCPKNRESIADGSNDYWTAKNRQVASPAKVLRKVYGDDFTEKEYASFTDMLVGKAQAILDVVKLQPPCDIPSIYCDGAHYPNGTIGSSCMRGMPREWFQIYADNCLGILTAHKDGKLIGRALLWKLPNGDTFMDRVYYDVDHTKEAFFEYALQSGYHRKTLQSHRCREEFIDKDGKEYTSAYSIGLVHPLTHYTHYPYCDTFAIAESKDAVALLTSGGGYSLTSTRGDLMGGGGGGSDVDYCCDDCGDGLDEDAGEVYISPGGTAYCETCFFEYYTYCAYCEETTERDETYGTDNGSICSNCYHEHHFSCSGCDEVYPDDEGVEGCGDTYCQACWDETFIACECCNEACARDETYELNDETLCFGCYESNSTTCSHCGERMHVDEMHHSGDVCTDCADEFYDECGECGEFLQDTDMTLSDGEYYCDECITGKEDN